MANPPADRSRYEAEQAAFVTSLIRGDGFPEGLHPAKAAAASRSLWRKRLRAVAGTWPALALGEGFEARFERYARAVPPPAVGDGFTDGLAFASTLSGDELTDDVRVEVLLARAAVVSDRRGTFRDRRGLFAGMLSLREPQRILLVLRAPLIGRRVLVIPLRRG